MAGIKVLTKEECLKTPGEPYLYININVNTAKTESDIYPYNIDVLLMQKVSLLRDPKQTTYAVTWSTGGVVLIEKSILSQLRTSVEEMVDLFIKTYLSENPESKNDPTLDALSQMSPYLHFGQISPLSIALKAAESRSSGSGAFLEELIVRRELSLNFVFYNEKYDSFEAVPEWAKKYLRAHRKDKRSHTYTLEEFESARTHDPYWNAAQKEMVVTGKMHGYMRMYWGKKIIEWSETPEDAFRTALHLNNKYELDGRDPNGFAGVAWCFGKHDRPWGERPVFGHVRYMNDNGLRRKFDADGYVRKMDLDKES